MGIGEAIANRLTAEGWLVVGVDQVASPTLDALADQVMGDVRDRETHESAIARADALGPLGAWVNNAGIVPHTPLHDLDQQLVRNTIEINSLGYIWGASAAVQEFLRLRLPGSIVNIGSIHGRLASSDHTVYEITKAGADALTRSIAVSYGNVGIRANAVAPGAIMTPHLRESFEIAGAEPNRRQELEDAAPLRRIGTPAEVAELVAFLVSDRAAFISGQSIAVDGAWSAQFGKPVPSVPTDHSG